MHMLHCLPPHLTPPPLLHTHMHTHMHTSCCCCCCCCSCTTTGFTQNLRLRAPSTIGGTVFPYILGAFAFVGLTYAYVKINFPEKKKVRY